MNVRISWTKIKRTELDESGLASVRVEVFKNGIDYATSTRSDLRLLLTYCQFRSRTIELFLLEDDVKAGNLHGTSLVSYKHIGHEQWKICIVQRASQFSCYQSCMYNMGSDLLT
jgi:hypothetical protein